MPLSVGSGRPIPTSFSAYKTIDYETGNMSQWGATATDGVTAAPTAVTTAPSSGTYHMAASVVAPNIRSEAADYTWLARESTLMYYGMDVRFVSPVPSGPWQLCAQWHNPVGTGAWATFSPPLHFLFGSTDNSADPANLYLFGGTNSGPNTYPVWQQSLGARVDDTWERFVFGLRFSTNETQCRVTAWRNGTQVLDAVPTHPLLWPSNASDRYAYLRCGVYRSHLSSGTATVYHDNVKWGPTYSSVA